MRPMSGNGDAVSGKVAGNSERGAEAWASSNSSPFGSSAFKGVINKATISGPFMVTVDALVSGASLVGMDGTAVWFALANSSASVLGYTNS